MNGKLVTVIVSDDVLVPCRRIRISILKVDFRSATAKDDVFRNYRISILMSPRLDTVARGIWVVALFGTTYFSQSRTGFE